MEVRCSLIGVLCRIRHAKRKGASGCGSLGMQSACPIMLPYKATGMLLLGNHAGCIVFTVFKATSDLYVHAYGTQEVTSVRWLPHCMRLKEICSLMQPGSGGISGHEPCDAVNNALQRAHVAQ